MQITPELLVGLGITIAIAIVLLAFRARAARRRRIQRPVSRGPANLHVTCAGCSEQFTHTKRTLGGWEKGTRHFYCKTCHKKWCGSQFPQPPQSDTQVPVSTPGSAPKSREQSLQRNSAQPSFSRRAGRSGLYRCRRAFCRGFAGRCFRDRAICLSL